MIDWRKAEAFAKQAVEEFDIRTPSLAAEARTLSGGNIQKIVLARELSGKPRLVVASHPTYGLDIGSTNHTHELLLAVLLAALVALAFWKVPPWLVVAATAGIGWAVLG